MLKINFNDQKKVRWELNIIFKIRWMLSVIWPNFGEGNYNFFLKKILDIKIILKEVYKNVFLKIVYYISLSLLRYI